MVERGMLKKHTRATENAEGCESARRNVAAERRLFGRSD